MNANMEPSLQGIDDYDNHESSAKRKTVNRIVLALVVIGIIFAAVRFNDQINEVPAAFSPVIQK